MDHLPGTPLAGLRRRDRRYGRGERVDLQRAGGVRRGAGEIGRAAKMIVDRRAVGIEAGDGEVRCVLPGGDRVGEGERARSRAARIGGCSAIVQNQRRTATGDRHRFVERDRQRDDLARVEIASAIGDAGAGRRDRRDRRPRRGGDDARRRVARRGAGRIGDGDGEAGGDSAARRHLMRGRREDESVERRRHRARGAADSVHASRGVIGAAAEVRQRAVGGRRQRDRHILGLAEIRLTDTDVGKWIDCRLVIGRLTGERAGDGRIIFDGAGHDTRCHIARRGAGRIGDGDGEAGGDRAARRHLMRGRREDESIERGTDCAA